MKNHNLLDMKRNCLFLMVLLLSALSVDATPIGKQRAQSIARDFMTQKGLKIDRLRPVEKMAKVKADGTSPYYVFNNGQDGGFVIVSGDDIAPKVIGYSYTGTFEEANVPDNIKAWLDYCAEQIETLTNHPNDAARLVRSATQTARISISPLVMTHWNQYAPYYNLTPIRNGKQCVTGCVATAFAQVMKYYEWPKLATTTVPGYSWNGSTLEDLAPITFQWSDMLYDYQGGGNYNAGCSDPETNQTAVAQLMKYCGYAVKAGYNSSSTSASTSYIPAALKDYFGYQGPITSVDRSSYSSSDWDDLIYNEIYHGRPVIYSGSTSSNSGHAFICDGYGEDGYFHINWGWGGLSDGYYLLSILEPGKQGAGGSNSGYNYGQSAIVGIQPGASDEVIVTGPCLKILNFIVRDYKEGYIENYGVQYFGVGYRLQGMMDGEHQLSAQLLQNGEVVYQGRILNEAPWGIDLGVGHYNPNTILYPFFSNIYNIADGTYEVRLVCRMEEEGKEYEWVPCLGSEYYHNEVTINRNSDTPVIYFNSTVSPQIECNSLTTPSTIYVNNKISAVASLTNKGGTFFQDKIYLWINDNMVASDMAYIDAGKTIGLSFAYKPTVTGNLPVKVTLDSDGEEVIYTGSINVVNEPENGTYQLELTSWNVENADEDSKKICSGVVTGTMTVTNTGTKTFSGVIGIGYTDGSGTSSMSYNPSGYTLAVGESVDLEYTVKNPTIGQKYKLVCWANLDWNKKIGETPMYELVESGYTYWTADGTPKTKAVSGNTSITVVPEAVAVKFFTTPTGTIGVNSNPNTIYYISGNTTPSSLSGKNVVLNGKINEVKFVDGYDFYVPLGFTAQKATYSRVPTHGASGNTGWETIVFPFAVQKVFNATNNKQISWFTNDSDTGKDFWFEQFAYTDGVSVYFDYVDEIRANVPYLIATPGNDWGAGHNLLNKTIAFTADNVNIPQTSKLKSMTDPFQFVGLSEMKNVSGYVLDDSGKSFVLKEGVSQDAFRAYFKKNTNFGDVNGDGQVNITDVSLLVNNILGMENEGFIVNNADISSDGQVNITDVTTLVNYILLGGSDTVNMVVNGSNRFIFSGVGN